VESKSSTLRELHRGPKALVLPNAWDVASGLALAALPGCRALATTSGGIARSLGYEDGEQMPRDEMLRAVERIAAAVDLPVTADLEAGYGDPVGTAERAAAAGLAGLNLEDSRRGSLLPVDEQVEIVRAVRAAVPDLVLNARVDVYVRKAGGVDEAVERANAYLAAGADCAYPILAPHEHVAELVRRIDGPVNAMLRPGGPTAAALEQLGVRRITWGSGLASAALDAAVALARQSLE
jgi:2-methylisocitrate lyase-like PEP mutase family enzyme